MRDGFTIMALYFITDRTMHRLEGSTDAAVPSKRYESYLATLQSIRDTQAWKTSGTGAMFAGTARDPESYEANNVRFAGLAPADGTLIYALCLEDMGGLYRVLRDESGSEAFLLAQQDTYFGGIAARGDQLAVTVGGHPKCLHLGVMSLADQRIRTFTDGDTIEESPCWSADGRRIYCSSAGYAQSGAAHAVLGPRAICVLDPVACTFEEVRAAADLDYLRPYEDAQGNLYCIRQPYKGSEKSSLLEDILLFPGRIVKAIGGLLNWFSIRYGGESLRSGNLQNGDRRARQKNEEELFFEGNLIQASKNAKESERRGEKYPSFLPHSRVLLRIAPDGTETVLAHGVLDYAMEESGAFYCSNGQYILHYDADGKNETVCCKAKLAVSLAIGE